MQSSDISKMLEVAIVSARLAGQRAIEEQKYTKSSIKNGREIVTQADLLCQNLIIERIKETYPDHGFIAEEGPDNQMLKQLPRGSESIWWVIDPIDGTNNFARGLLSFSVSIAAFYNGEPIVGVVFEPSTDSMFTTAKGMDAQLNSTTIRSIDEDLTEFSCFGIDNHELDKIETGIWKIINRCRFRNIGSTALHLAYVAMGGFAGTVTIIPKLWDIAAGYLLVKNAGGIITDLKGKDLFPVNLQEYNVTQFQVLASNKKIHKELLTFFE